MKDEKEGITFVQRTTREITKAMCSLTDFLRFTGEDCSMFQDGTLPTLDTALWMSNGQVLFKFFEKPTVGNQVLTKNTALPTSCLWSSLLQEAVRRLQNCSDVLDSSIKQEVLSNYCQKLINSGHSIRSARIIIVQGVVKFLWKSDMNKLPVTDPCYRPLYLSKDYREDDRQITKYQARMEWYKCGKKDRKNECNAGWRKNLSGVWKGSNSSQKPTLDKGFSTVLNIPNTAGARLAKKLIKLEPGLAKMTKYNVRIIEKSGIQLSRLFQRVYSPKTCHWPSCPVCQYSEEGKRSKCRAANVVYEAKCCECLQLLEKGEIDEGDVGIYVGETSRTLVERVTEHATAAENVDVENFITKHWALKHRSLGSYPKMKFRVLKQCKDALTRQVSEAVWIENCSNMNSRSEWGKNSLSRLKVDKAPWVKDSVDEKRDKELNEIELHAFKEERKKDTSVRPATLCSRRDPKDSVATNIRTKSRKRTKKDEDEDSIFRHEMKVIKRRRLSPSEFPATLVGGGGKEEVPVEGNKQTELERDGNEDPVGGNGDTLTGVAKELQYSNSWYTLNNEYTTTFLPHRVTGGSNNMPVLSLYLEEDSEERSFERCMFIHSAVSHNILRSTEARPDMFKNKACAEKWKKLLNGTSSKFGSIKKDARKRGGKKPNRSVLASQDDQPVQNCGKNTLKRGLYGKEDTNDLHIAPGSRSKRNKVIVFNQYFDRKKPLMNELDTPSTNPNFEFYRYQAPFYRRMDKGKPVNASTTTTEEEETTEMEMKGSLDTSRPESNEKGSEEEKQNERDLFSDPQPSTSRGRGRPQRKKKLLRKKMTTKDESSDLEEECLRSESNKKRKVKKKTSTPKR